MQRSYPYSIQQVPVLSLIHGLIKILGNETDVIFINEHIHRGNVVCCE